MSPRRIYFIISTIVLLFTGLSVYFGWQLLFSLLVLPLLLVLLGLFDLFQKKHSIKKNFPVIGHLRYMLEKIRPEIMQYFVETDTQGRPISRVYRSLIYRRSKNVNDTSAFGTQMDIYSSGYEWLDHSMYAKDTLYMERDPRVKIGGENCQQPYQASILNISAMSFGSLSDKAIMALNQGAKMGGFAHNTGEGGISDYHLKYGGDLIWQIGTGYFGCRTKDGKFDENIFEEKSQLEQVKMIEVKISQGAKPGHGGILPAIKNTKEIASIRGVEAGTTVHSPSSHSAFQSAEGLLYFIKKLRGLSGGKPVGFKVCIGKKKEFEDICKAMIITRIKPDFITIDGGEGGTAAAPVEFSNSLGVPMRDGLAFATDMLNGYDLKKDIKVIASGKIFSSFDIARAIALGADLVNSARAMMLAVGCIQSLQCNKNTCPVGVATQNKALTKGLNVTDKARRTYFFHKNTVDAFTELIAAAGVPHPSDLKRHHVNRRINMNKVLKYDDIFPDVAPKSYLNIFSGN